MAHIDNSRHLLPPITPQTVHTHTQFKLNAIVRGPRTVEFCFFLATLIYKRETDKMQ